VVAVAVAATMAAAAATMMAAQAVPLIQILCW